MESSVNTVIISVLGAGLIGMFGYFLRRITSDIQSLGARLEKRIDKLETAVGEMRSDIGTLRENVAAIAATQAEHGLQLGRMLEHGERIAALEGATFTASP